MRASLRVLHARRGQWHASERAIAALFAAYVHHAWLSCPLTCAACLEKPVAGAEGVSVCAVVGFHIDPVDRATAQGFIECGSGGDDPQCNSIFAEYAVATGCTPACVEASRGGPRNEVCDAIPTNSEAMCTATEIPAVCPDYPPPKLASDADVTPPPPPPAPQPPVQGDGAAFGSGSADAPEDTEATPMDGSTTRGLAPAPEVASGPDFGSTSSPSVVESTQESGTTATVGAAIAACAALAAVEAIL